MVTGGLVHLTLCGLAGGTVAFMDVDIHILSQEGPENPVGEWGRGRGQAAMRAPTSSGGRLDFCFSELVGKFPREIFLFLARGGGAAGPVISIAVASS